MECFDIYHDDCILENIELFVFDSKNFKISSLRVESIIDFTYDWNLRIFYLSSSLYWEIRFESI